MKAILCVLVSLRLCADLPAQTSTNLKPVLLTDVLKLTPEMERLNASEFYKSELNDFEQTRSHWLHLNRVYAPVEFERVWLDALRRVRYYENFALPPEIKNWLAVSLSFDRPLNLDFAPLLLLMIDGAKYQISPQTNLCTIGRGTESFYYLVTDDVIRAIGLAKRVQMRLDGRDIDRTLSSTNIARFKVFADAFIDEKRSAKSTLAQPIINKTAPPKTLGPFQVQDLSMKVIKADDYYWQYGWRLALQNPSTDPLVGTVEIKLLDNSGFAVRSDTEVLRLSGRETRTFTGSMPIRAAIAPTVTKVIAEWKR